MSKNEETLVLVADDEPSTLALVTAHVRSKGFKVVEASDGDMAWKLAHEHLPDLVILDVMMPGMSGWEVCRKIRESLPLAHTGVIMLTGIGEHLNEMTSPLYGADTHVDKPFEFSDLDDKIEDTLRSRREGAFGRPDHADEISADEEDAVEHVPAVTQPSPPMSDAMEADVSSEPPAVISITGTDDDEDEDEEAPAAKKPAAKKSAAKKPAAKKPVEKPASKKSAAKKTAAEKLAAPPAKPVAKKATKKAAKKAAKKATKKAAKKVAKKAAKMAKKAAKKATKKVSKKAAAKKAPAAKSAKKVPANAAAKKVTKKVAKKATRHPTTKKAAKKRR